MTNKEMEQQLVSLLQSNQKVAAQFGIKLAKGVLKATELVDTGVLVTASQVVGYITNSMRISSSKTFH